MSNEINNSDFEQQIAQLQAELDKIRKSEQRMSLALEAINDGLWDYDIESDEVFFNSQYYTMLGYEPYELPQSRQTWIDLLHPEDREKSVNYVDQCIKAQKGWSLEFRLRAKAGGYRWILGRGHVALRDENGKALRRVGTHTDITDRKEAEIEREQLIEKLNRSLETVKTLKGMLPICSHCKKIRDNKGYWNRIESYIGKHSNAEFSHSICPDCMKDKFPEFYEKLE